MFGIPGPYFEPLAIQERQSATTRKGPVFGLRLCLEFESRGLSFPHTTIGRDTKLAKCLAKNRQLRKMTEVFCEETSR